MTHEHLCVKKMLLLFTEDASPNNNCLVPLIQNDF